MNRLKKRFLTYVYALFSIAAVTFSVLRTSKGNVPIVYLLGTPAHANLGDQAIAYAERKFMEVHASNLPVVEVRLISKKIFNIQIRMLKRFIKHSDIIIGHGGGNMGDQYPIEEFARLSIIESFKDNKVIIFPQTIFYRDVPEANQMLESVKQAYSEHSNLTLIAREKESFATMRRLFPKNNIVLAPDIVLSLCEQRDDITRSGAMTCLRSDVEKSLSTSADKKIINILKDRFEKVNVSDTVSEDFKIITDRMRGKRLVHKWNEFRNAEIVVTDRLHGMIFAAITGTPCVVFSNYNHKVTGTYKDWLSSIESIRLCSDVESLSNDIENVIRLAKKPANDLYEKYMPVLLAEIMEKRS